MATAVQVEKIGTNAYAPADAADVNLYSFNDADELTLAQLVMAVCIRNAALVESQSVLKMNEINESAAWLEILAEVGEAVLTKSSLTAPLDLSKTSYVPEKVPVKTTYRDFLALEVGLGYDVVPKTLSSVDEKTELYKKLENEMNAATTDNQTQTIELQSLISRRDAAYNASASTVKKLGTTMTVTAGNF